MTRMIPDKEKTNTINGKATVIAIDSSVLSGLAVLLGVGEERECESKTDLILSKREASTIADVKESSVLEGVVIVELSVL